MSLSLSFLESLDSPDLADGASAAAFREIADTATRFDGYPPFNEQSLLDAAAGRRRPALIVRGAAAGGVGAVGAAIIGRDELDLVILPEHRRHGFGTVAVEQLLPHVDAEHDLTAWAHGDHPAARALAAHFGFVPVRTLLQLRMPLDTGESGPQSSSSSSPSGSAEPADMSTTTPPIVISAFRPGIDDAEWVALNALIFASHPEQGAVTLADLADRMAEPWFDAGDFLLAREAPSSDDLSDAGRLIGYNWLKIEHPDADGNRLGEIYVIGVHPDAAGRGLGRILMQAGLQRMRARGCSSAALYVEAVNAGAVHLYRSLGFADHTIDVQYRRVATHR